MEFAVRIASVDNVCSLGCSSIAFEAFVTLGREAQTDTIGFQNPVVMEKIQRPIAFVYNNMCNFGAIISSEFRRASCKSGQSQCKYEKPDDLHLAAPRFLASYYSSGDALLIILRLTPM